MKKVLLLGGVLLFNFTFSQCNILGKSTINPNQTETYSVEVDNAQCNDCHLWSTIGSNLEIDGEFRKNNVKIKSINSGKAVLSLSLLTSQGLIICNKNLTIGANGQSEQIQNIENQKTVSDNISSNSTSTNPDCNINITNYKEVKFAEGIVSYFPDTTNNDIKYIWTAIYQNGDQKESREKVPQFTYSKENGIQTLKLEAISNKCIKKYSKNYDITFWKFF